MTMTELQREISLATSRYSKLVLIVGGDDAARSAALHEYAALAGSRPLNVGLRIASVLVSSPTRRRPMLAVDAFQNALDEFGGVGIGLLNHLEALFLKELQLDPLKLLLDSARNFVLVANWPGFREGERLSYAMPGHPEYVSWQIQDCGIVDVTRDRNS
jgi:hypothetical protein